MKKIIDRFTMGDPKAMFAPTLWLFFEGFSITFPAIAIYFAINTILEGYSSLGNIDFDRLFMISWVMVGLFLLQLLITTSTFLGTFLPGAKKSAEDKIKFTKKLRSLSLGYFSKKEIGGLINTYVEDFLAIEQAMVGVFTGLFGVVLSCVLTSVFMFIFNYKMALAFYIAMPLSALIIVLSLSTYEKLTNMNKRAKDKAADYLNEYLLGMKVLKSYNLTGSGFSKLKNAYVELKKVNVKAETLGGVLLAISITFLKMGLPLICLTGAYLVLGGELNLATYLSLIIIATKILTPLLTWVRYMALLKSQYVSAKRIDKVMKEQSLHGQQTVKSVETIAFNDVSFRYMDNGEDVLKNISFKVPKNQLTAIVGPSGGGKSTILRLIARFWDTTSGNIDVNGIPLNKIEPEKWLENISMVLQDVYLFNTTIKENIIFGHENVSDEKLIEVSQKAGCHNFILKLPDGYETIVGEGGSTLSGGEKQRISIARALLKDAPVLLLDEPTANLDARNEQQIQNAIDNLVKNKTVIMIAHRLKTVQNADNILVLNKGVIAEKGKHAELINSDGLYNRLWTLQNTSKQWKLSRRT